MKVAIFQHAETEPAGYFEIFFDRNHIPFEYIRLYERGTVPSINASHYLFLGGPMSVNDEEIYPYLKDEKELIREKVKKGCPVLGICLGAQLIASAFGARVHPYRNETGWCTLTRETGATGTFPRFPLQFSAFQLHSETFDIPPGARLQCTGDIVRNQAFSYKSALGLQFHLELTEPIIHEWFREFDPYVRDLINEKTPQYLLESNRLCGMIAEDFIK